MAFGMDFLKKAVGKITETKANIEKEIKDKREKPYREEAEKRILVPDCEHGDCVVMPDLFIGYGASCFYTTCNKEQCPKYCEHKNHIYTAVDARMLRYFKQYQKWYEEPDLYKNHIPYPLEEMVKDLFPNLASASDAIIRICNYWRLDKDNYLLKLARELHDCGVKFTEEDDLQSKLDYLCEVARKDDLTIFAFYPREKVMELFYNPSLYKREFEDFKYTVFICLVVSHSQKLQEYFSDITLIDHQELLDEEGNIKPAGRLEKSLSTDTIHGVVEEWTRLYGKDNE